MKNEVRPIDTSEKCGKMRLKCGVNADSRNKPLTLEQLRGMDGQPVMVKYLESEDGGINTGVILMNDPNESDNGVYVGCTFFCIKEYEKTWLAYAYPTAHIDREAWTAEWIYPENKWNLPICSKCGCNSQDATYGHKDNFCPRCGRAMKPEAWAELEKRMGVRV